MAEGSAPALRQAARAMRAAAMTVLAPNSARRAMPWLGQVGISMDGHQLCLASITRPSGGKPRLVRCECRPLPRLQDAGVTLRQVFADPRLQQLPCNLVLGPDDYRWLLIDTPELSSAELHSAVRWRIQELIDFPVTEAVLDVFDMPHAGDGAGGQRSRGVVVCRSATVAQHAATLTRGAVPLSAIDVPEFALRNLCALLPPSEQATALLHVQTEHALLLIVRDGTLYVSRRIPVGYAGADAAVRLAYEVLRSVEYYEGRFAEAVGSVQVAPLAESVPGLVEEIAQAVDAPVHLLALDELLDCPSGSNPALQARALLAIGAALRREWGNR